MSYKNVKLELCCTIGGNYVVKRVTNSTEWTPGECMKKEVVTVLARRPGLTVVVTASR